MYQAKYLKQMYKWRLEAANLLSENQLYAPIFLRLERDIAAAEAYIAAHASDDPLTRARAIANAYIATA